MSAPAHHLHHAGVDPAPPVPLPPQNRGLEEFTAQQLDDIETVFLAQLLIVASLGCFTSVSGQDLDLIRALEQEYLTALPVTIRADAYNTEWLQRFARRYGATGSGIADLTSCCLCLKRGVSEERTNGRFLGAKADLVQAEVVAFLVNPIVQVLAKLGRELKRRYKMTVERLRGQAEAKLPEWQVLRASQNGMQTWRSCLRTEG